MKNLQAKTSLQTTLTYQLVAELLSRMEAEGFPVGVDRHLQVQELLARLPEDSPPESLKALLVPLLATNPLEQERLYELFDESLASARAVLKRLPEPPASSLDPERHRLRWLLPVLLLALLGLAAIPLAQWITQLRPAPPVYRSLTIEGRSTHQLCLDSLVQLSGISLVDSFRLIGEGASEYGNARIEEQCLKYVAANLSATDTVGMLLFPREEGERTFFLAFRIQPVADTIPEETDQIAVDTPEPDPPSRGAEPEPAEDRFTQLPVERPFRLAQLQVFEQRGLGRLYYEYEWLLEPLFLLLLAGFLFFLLRARELRRRKLIAELDKPDKPPYIWNIEIEDMGEEIDLGDHFQSVLNLLRQRTADDYRRLDVPRTISATIDRAGFTSFQYAQQTRPPEYLLLIDRQSRRNHRAHLFNRVFKAFRANEIYAERFFFDGDIRLCQNEAYPDGLSLKELHHRYPNARLLILGQGYQMLSTFTGKPARWTEIFTLWRERALLTPRPIESWGKRERKLGGLFRVLPATLQGMAYLIDLLDSGEEPGLRDWEDKIADASRRPVVFQGGLLNTLQTHYDSRMLRWIASCAVYPDLDWDLTLYLGQRLSTEERPLLTLSRLQDLTRLPWFVEGRIPDPARAVLLGWLEERDPALLRRVREDLQTLLKKQPVPPDSVAWESHTMSLALNEWMLTRNRRRKKELEQEIGRMLEEGVEPDFAVVKYLDRERTPLDFMIPDRWKKYVHPGGYSGLGWKGMARDGWLAGLAWLVFASFTWFYNPQPPCAGYQAEYQAQDSLNVRNLYFDESAEDLPPASQQPTLQVCLSTQVDSTHYFGNLALDFASFGNTTALRTVVEEVIESDDLGEIGRFVKTRLDSLLQLMEDTRGPDSLKVQYLESVARAVYNSVLSLSGFFPDSESFLLNYPGDSAARADHPAYRASGGSDRIYFLHLLWESVQDQPPDDQEFLKGLAAIRNLRRNFPGTLESDLNQTDLDALSDGFEQFVLRFEALGLERIAADYYESWLDVIRKEDDELTLRTLFLHFIYLTTDGWPGFEDLHDQLESDLLESWWEVLQQFEFCPLLRQAVLLGPGETAIQEAQEICQLKEEEVMGPTQPEPEPSDDCDQALRRVARWIDEGDLKKALAELEATRKVCGPDYHEAILDLTIQANESRLNRLREQAASGASMADLADRWARLEAEYADRFVLLQLRGADYRDRFAVVQIELDRTPGQVFQQSNAWYEPECEAYLDQARALVRKEAYEQAIAQYSAAARLCPDENFDRIMREVAATYNRWRIIETRRLDPGGSRNMETLITRLEGYLARGVFPLEGQVTDREFEPLPDVGILALDPKMVDQILNIPGTREATNLDVRTDGLGRFAISASLMGSAGRSAGPGRESVIRNLEEVFARPVIQTRIVFGTEGMEEPLVISLDLQAGTDPVQQTGPASTRPEQTQDPLPSENPEERPDPTDPVPDSRPEADKGPVSTRRDLGKMIFVPGGNYQRGCQESKGTYGVCPEAAQPPHDVALRNFFIGQYEVTFREYDAFCQATGRDLPADEGWGRGDRPAINVSWNDAVAYCNWRSKQEGFQPVYDLNNIEKGVFADFTRNGFRLPTEAEWEYAARNLGKQMTWAGTSSEQNLGEYAHLAFDESSLTTRQTQVGGRSTTTTRPVGSLKPNGLSLYDMTGNVAEWCWDFLDDYKRRELVNPMGPDKGGQHVIRGGHHAQGIFDATNFYRTGLYPTVSTRTIGFRLARSDVGSRK